MRVIKITYRYILALLLTILFAFHSYDFFIFEESPNENARLFYYIVVGLLSVLIAVAIHLLETVIKGIKNGEKKTIIGILIFTIVFLGLFLIGYSSRPGNWGFIADELMVYYAMKHLFVWYSQGLISTLCMSLPMIIYPNPFSIILFEIFIYSLVVSYISTDIFFALKRKANIICYFILFLSPCMIAYVLCPIRASYFSMVVLLMVHLIYKLWDEKSIKSIYFIRIIYLSFLCCILRTEGCIIAILAMIFLINKAHGMKDRFIRAMVITSCLALLLTVYKSITVIGGGISPRQHELVTFVAPLSMILSDDSRVNMISSQDLNNINNVFPIETFREYPSETTTWQWKYGSRSFAEPTVESVKKFKRSAFKICISNMDIFLKCRIKSFMHSVALSDEISIYYYDNNTLMSSEYIEDKAEFDCSLAREYTLLHVIFWNWKYGYRWFYIGYAFWVPMLLILFYGIRGIAVKNIRNIFISAGYYSVLALVIITAPARYNMYYLMFYLVGWKIILDDIFVKENIDIIKGRPFLEGKINENN